MKNNLKLFCLIIMMFGLYSIANADYCIATTSWGTYVNVNVSAGNHHFYASGYITDEVGNGEWDRKGILTDIATDDQPGGPIGYPVSNYFTSWTSDSFYIESGQNTTFMGGVFPTYNCTVSGDTGKLYREADKPPNDPD